MPYCAPWWLPGGHAQTIVPARVIPAPRVAYRRERWDTPDGDFIDVDFVASEPADVRAETLVLFHGLEGDSRSHYARVFMRGCIRRAWRGMVVHFRGCSGEPNRLPRAYHSGDSEEIDWILRRVALRWPKARRFAVGVSLGGNVLAKWAGECGRQAADIVHACATISAPFDLTAGGRALDRRSNCLYAYEFLRTLRKKALAKQRQFPGIADARKIASSRSFYEFDGAFTAPLHGFASTLDYWKRASAKPFLTAIAVPTLALNACNDPIVPAQSLPGPREVSNQMRLDTPSEGGHAGFFSDGRGAERWYLRERVFHFFQKGD